MQTMATSGSEVSIAALRTLSVQRVSFNSVITIFSESNSSSSHVSMLLDSRTGYTGRRTWRVAADIKRGKDDVEKRKTFLKNLRVVLKFVWLEQNIGLALDQKNPMCGNIPLTPYYFWPRVDAWEEIRSALDCQPWITQERKVALLNQATDIIKLWQQTHGLGGEDIKLRGHVTSCPGLGGEDI